MNERVFEQFRDLILRECGIALTLDKQQLVANRIRKRLKALALESAEAYLQFLLHDRSGTEILNLIDAISTNVTYFYREHEHFVHLESLLTQYRSRGVRRLRIWCAASSTGEEPYMLALLCHRCLPDADARVLATDISYKVLNKAVEGIYEAKQLERMPGGLIGEYFKRIDAEHYSVIDELRRRVLFKRLNLSQFPYPLRGPIDVIFCRNVMIYFDQDLRQKICNEFTRLLTPGGHLFLGQSESLVGISHSLEKEDGVSSVFRKPLSLTTIRSEHARQ